MASDSQSSFHLTRSRAIVLCLLALDWLLLAIATVKHTIWRDEAQAWLIARDSTGLASLIKNLRFEGHPPLWHIILMPLTHATSNPAWIKLPTFCFAAALGALLLAATELPLFLRVGLTFSYYFLFEYGVIARNYELGVLLLVAAALLVCRERSHRLVLGTTLLCLAVFTSLSALVLSSVLFLVLLYLCSRREARVTASVTFPRRAWWFATATAIYATVAITSLCLIHPPSTSEHYFLPRHPITPIYFLYSLRHDLASAYFPLIATAPNFWGPSPSPDGITANVLALLAFAAFIVLACLFRNTVARIFLIVSTILLTLQLQISNIAYVRHLGWLFVALAISSILEHSHAKPEAQSAKRAVASKAILAIILAAQVVAGFSALWFTTRYPFSRSKEVAEYLEANHLTANPLACAPDYVCTAVLAYLHWPTYYSTQQHRPISFIIWTHEEYITRRMPFPQDMPHGSALPPVLITEKPLTDAKQQELHVQLHANYIASDRYFIYY